MAVAELCPQSGSSGPDGAGDAPPSSSPGGRLCRRRQAAAAPTSAIVARALASSGGAGPAARALDISQQHVHRFADPEHAAAITLRDIRAIGGSFARSIAEQLLAALDADGFEAPEVPLPDHVLRVAADVGGLAHEVTEALRDNVLTKQELEQVLKQAQRLTGHSNAICRSVTRRLDRLDGGSR